MTERAPGRSTPVLICGGGPVGLALAVELGLRDVECVLVESRLEPTRLRPRAKTLSIRTMEHLRRWGLAERLREVAPLPTWWSKDVAFRTSYLGREIERFTGVLGLGDEEVTPELGQQLPQYVLEDLLREVVSELPTCELRLGSRVTGVSNGTDSVEVQVVGSDDVQESVRAEYVVGADGGRSVVRAAIGARYLGSQALRPNTGLVFRSDALVGLQRHPPAVQTWLLNQDTPGMMGPIDLAGLWWLIAFGVDGTSPDLDPQRIIDGALGQHVPAELISTDLWTARMELVDRCRDGRVFLAGDAAHLNPPFGGHGLNTGIGDAVDLGWKLAATLAGWAGPALLGSYVAERRPLHQRVIDEATTNMATLAGELLAADLDAVGPAGDAARDSAAARIRETKRAEYFSLDLVLGHRYERSPVIPASRERLGAWSERAAAGRRLPHAWVSPGVSTLDLVGPEHTALVPDEVTGGRLAEAASAAGLPLRVVLVESHVLDRLDVSTVVIRPDQVVAWCGEADLTAATAALKAVAGHATGRHHPAWGC